MITMTWPQYLRRECTVRLTGQMNEALSVLLMRYPAPVPVDELIEALWPEPDHEPDTPDHLSVAITRLRAQIGQRIAKDRRGYRLIQYPSDLRNVT